MSEKNFDAFKETIEQKFMHHPVVTDNAYTAWFARGAMTLDELRHFTVQFSVFSNQFLLAALNRAINADTLQATRESKEILMNELGVIYNDRGAKGHARAESLRPRRLPTTIAKAILPWSRPKSPSTAARSVSRPRTSSGCCGSASRSGSRSTTWASAGMAPPARCFSAMNSSASTAATITTKRWARRLPSRTGRPPVSGRS